MDVVTRRTVPQAGFTVFTDDITCGNDKSRSRFGSDHFIVSVQTTPTAADVSSHPRRIQHLQRDRKSHTITIKDCSLVTPDTALRCFTGNDTTICRKPVYHRSSEMIKSVIDRSVIDQHVYSTFTALYG